MEIKINLDECLIWIHRFLFLISIISIFFITILASSWIIYQGHVNFPSIKTLKIFIGMLIIISSYAYATMKFLEKNL